MSDPMNQDGSPRTMTRQEFEQRLAKFTKQERAYILKMRATIYQETK